MKHFLPPLLSLAFLFTSLNLTAQPYRVAGKVMSQEDRSPLPGVAVQLVGTDRGVFSDAEGQFSLEVPHDSAQLRFAYVGHEVLLLPAVLKKEMKVYLIPLTAELDEVVIVGVAEERSTRAYGAPVSVARTESITKSPKKRKIRIRGAATPKYRPSAAPPPPPEAKPSPIMMDSPTDAKAAGYIMIEDDKAEDDFSSESDDIASGQLTAGELNDFSKWNLWEDINEGVLESYRSIWKMYPDHRYTVQLKNLDGKPLVNARLALMDKANTVLWSARTDNTGKAELWAGLFSEEKIKAGKYRLEASFNGEIATLPSARPFKNGINVYELPLGCEAPSGVDIAFVVDATGSMGDEIQYLKAELRNVIERARDSLPGLDFQLGSVFYRDHGDDYLTRLSALSSDIDQTAQFIRRQSAGGGGDGPEAVEEALDVAVNQLQWRESARTRLLFLVLDAPPHQDEATRKKLTAAIRQAANLGIRIIPVTGSGIDKSTEYLMRSIALATNGTYTFLTNHSGIGGDHIEPTTDSYEVELLNDLLIRLIYQYTHVPSCEPQPDPLASLPQDMEPKITNAQHQNLGGQLDSLSWKFYPNPTSGPLTIELDKRIETVYVVDISGKILEKHETKDQLQLQLDLSPYAEGIYFLKGQGKKGGVTGKVVRLHNGSMARH